MRQLSTLGNSLMIKPLWKDPFRPTTSTKPNTSSPPMKTLPLSSSRSISLVGNKPGNMDSIELSPPLSSKISPTESTSTREKFPTENVSP
jgi:hypothetical protein